MWPEGSAATPGLEPLSVAFKHRSIVHQRHSCPPGWDVFKGLGPQGQQDLGWVGEEVVNNGLWSLTPLAFTQPFRFVALLEPKHNMAHEKGFIHHNLSG